MALSFNQTQGKAQKNAEAYKYTDGDNVVRIFGGILPRYLYWLKTGADKSIPVECLAFNRDKEKFDGLEVDHVQKFFPEAKCQWSYSVNCIDPKDGKVKVLNLKKKLFEQILTTAEDLGDPTDIETGWDICFKKVKTGSLAWNVEYTLQPLRCKVRPLTEDERKAVAESESIDTKYKRPTADEVLEILNSISEGGSGSDDTESDAEKEAAQDLT